VGWGVCEVEVVGAQVGSGAGWVGAGPLSAQPVADLTPAR
jgi:hypothetical protein